VLGDFDGDGLADVLISEPAAAELMLYLQVEGQGLDEPVRFPAYSGIEGLSVADIEGDGRDEVAILSVSEKVIGVSAYEDGRFGFPEPLEVEGEPLAMALADVDLDATIDCVYISADKEGRRQLRVLANVGQVEAADANSGSVFESLGLEELAGKPAGMKVFDVDQDGLLDVLIFRAYDEPILARQVERGRFETVASGTSQGSLIRQASLGSTGLADVDGEAGAELLVAQQNFARSLRFSEDGRWTVVDQYNAQSKENRISTVAAFDIDGDGRRAVLLLDGQKGSLQVLRRGEDGTYRFDREVEVGRWGEPAHLKMLYAALSGDSQKDVLAFDSEKFALVSPPAGGEEAAKLEEFFSYETKIKDGAYGNLAAGDINSDGRVDIVLAEYKNNNIEILTRTPAGETVAGMRFKVFEQKRYQKQRGRQSSSGVEPRELEVADVTGDGKADLVTVIHDRIIVYPQD
jgi:hypothetical protein